MNKYLSAVGFSEYNSYKKLRDLKKEVIEQATRKEVHNMGDDEFYYVYEKDYGECFGLCVIKIGESEEESEIDSFFPYMKGCNFLFNEKFEIDPCSDKEGYYVYCDDNNLGIPMIFFINNPLEFRHNRQYREGFDDDLNCAMLSGLALDGVVILPIEKNEDQRQNEMKKIEQRNQMINAAKSGSIEAMEHLTLEDMSTFTKANIRSKREDIFTIVSSYFMPYTVECDKYSVLAEITDVMEMKNSKTKEELYHISLNCNSIEFEILINKKNLIGVPAKGRRWKGHVWMQGQMDYL